MFPIIKLASAFQNVEDISQVQLAFEYIQNILLFLIIILAVLVMMLIPVLLSFGMIDNLLKVHKFKNKIDHEICAKSNTSDNRISASCKRYQMVYSRFVQYFFGLAAWNFFSLAYIFIAFSDFKSGVIAYFNFPMEVIKSIDNQNLLNSFSNFDRNWYYMLGITVLTILCLFVGRNIGAFFGKNIIENKGLNVAFN